MSKYTEYVKVNRSFVPVYTQENDAEHGDAWMSFIPHVSLKNILMDLMKALDGGQQADRKSLWMAGSYGTGKTYAVFVLKHLLEDDLATVEQYFQQYPLIRDLWERFEALRKRKPKLLTLFASSAGSVASDAMLFMEIQRRVIAALREKGYIYFGSTSLRDRVIEKLSSGILNFDKLFEQNQDLFEGVYSQASEVRKALSEHPEDNMLVENVLQVLIKEGQYIGGNSVDDLKSWLKDVIAGNHLDSIVFIWDEFTSYFENNRSSDTLQEIVHAAQSAAAPFYFVLVTHRRLEQYAHFDADAKRKIQNRFYLETLTMNGATPYKLMANALQMDSAKSCVWESKRISMWDTVSHVFNELRRGFPAQASEYNEDDFRGLIPLHPFAAFLLTNLSALFSANQRTMFSFLRSTGGSEDKPDFQWFIQTAGPDSDRKWLTADYLWDYFFSDYNQDIDSGALERVNYYKINAERLDGEELRIFKASMLLLLLELKATGVTFLRALKSNLDLMFWGTDLTSLRINEILSRLEQKGLLQLTAQSGPERQISMPMLNIDMERIQQILSEKSAEWSFERNCAVNGELASAVMNIRTIESPNRFAERYLVRCATKANVTATLTDLAGRLNSNQIGLMFLIQKEPTDEADCRRFIEQAITDLDYDRIAFIHITQPFGKENWGRWQEAKARIQYATDMRDGANIRVFNDRSKRVIDEWIDHVRISQNRFYTQKHNKLIGTDIWREADQFAKEIYPAGMEVITENDNLYGTAISANSVKFGLGLNVNNMGRFDALVRSMREKGIWDSPEALENRPAEPLARARKALAEMLKQAGPRPVTLSDIWNRFTTAPFGYLKVQLVCVLIGYFFKEYIDKGYYLFDGHNTSALSVEGIASAVENLLKTGNIPYSISKMRNEHIFLCNQLADFFNIQKEQAGTLQDLRKQVRTRVVELRYPLWLAASCDNVTPASIQLFEDLSNFVYHEDEARQIQLADSLYSLVFNQPNVLSNAREVLRADRLATAMYHYLQNSAPKSISWLNQLKFSSQQILEEFRRHIAQEGYWLWDRQKFEDELVAFEQETSLAQLLSRLVSEPAATLGRLKQQLLNRFGKLHIPSWLFSRRNAELGILIQRLHRFAKDQSREDAQQMVQDYQSHIENLVAILGDELTLLDEYAHSRSEMHLSREILRTEVLEKLPSGCYEMDQNTYNAHIDNILFSMAAAQKFSELASLWREIANTDNPSEASQNIATPIAWLPVFSSEEGRALVAMLDNKRPHDLHDIERQLHWLKRNQEHIAHELGDKTLHNNIWINDIAGQYRPMLRDIPLAEVQANLPRRSELGQKVHDWAYKKDKVRETVQGLLKHLYDARSRQDVYVKIDCMDPSTCKEYLKRLVKDNDLVGLAILEENQ